MREVISSDEMHEAIAVAKHMNRGVLRPTNVAIELAMLVEKYGLVATLTALSEYQDQSHHTDVFSLLYDQGCLENPAHYDSIEQAAYFAIWQWDCYDRHDFMIYNVRVAIPDWEIEEATAYMKRPENRKRLLSLNVSNG